MNNTSKHILFMMNDTTLVVGPYIVDSFETMNFYYIVLKKQSLSHNSVICKLCSIKKL